MRPGKQFGLSAIEKSDIWSRWKAGHSLHELGRAFDKPHSRDVAVQPQGFAGNGEAYIGTLLISYHQHSLA
jgi:hypothetical protein